MVLLFAVMHDKSLLNRNVLLKERNSKKEIEFFSFRVGLFFLEGRHSVCFFCVVLLLLAAGLFNVLSCSLSCCGWRIWQILSGCVITYLEKRGWFPWFSMICDMCSICHGLFALPLGGLEDYVL